LTFARLNAEVLLKLTAVEHKQFHTVERW